MHLRDYQTKPCYIMMSTVIGKGSPNKAGTHKVHGSPLGAEEVEATKKALGLPEEEFYVPQSVYNFFEQKSAKDAALEQKWKEMFRIWTDHYCVGLAINFWSSLASCLPAIVARSRHKICAAFLSNRALFLGNGINNF